MITRTLTIHCDHTECVDSDGHALATSTTAEARAEAADAGWTSRRGLDYCPRHADATETLR